MRGWGGRISKKGGREKGEVKLVGPLNTFRSDLMPGKGSERGLDLAQSGGEDFKDQTGTFPTKTGKKGDAYQGGHKGGSGPPRPSLKKTGKGTKSKRTGKR